MSIPNDTSTEKQRPKQKAAEGRKEEELQLRERALASGLLLLEKHGKGHKGRLLKEFLQDPVKFILENNYCDLDYNEYARQLAVYVVEELQCFQGIMHTHKAMNQAGSVLNTFNMINCDGSTHITS